MSIPRAAARKLLWIVLSLGVLTLLFAAIELAGRTLLQYRQQVDAIRTLERRIPQLAGEEGKAVAGRIDELRRAPPRLIQERLDAIGRNLAQHGGLAGLRSMSQLRIAEMAVRGELERQIRTEIQVELWKQEQAYLGKLLQFAAYRTAAEDLDKLTRQRDEAYEVRERERTRYRQVESKFNAIERAAGSRIFPAVAEFETARDRWYAATRTHAELYQRTEQLRESLRLHPVKADPGVFAASLEGTSVALGQVLASASAEAQGKVDGSWLNRLGTAWWPYVLAAARVVAGGVVLYVGWKALFFFVVAPWVASRPPLRIDAGAKEAAPRPESPLSVVSLRVALYSGQELLAKDAYLQDTPSKADARTQMFLNPRYPLACFASGMFGLTRVGAGPGGATITLSSTVNPLDELAEVPLSASCGVVLLPRVLVAVVQDAGAPIVIRSVWRIGSLQAWLTGQLRYLVFFGPGQAIVSGCRGVRIEQPDAQRRIAQAATVGFSASLDYANARTETFLPYLLGMKPLFNDCFGGQGFYAYQEVPASRPGSGADGRIMGMFDVLLKPFGI
jgi:hypothetical protein